MINEIIQKCRNNKELSNVKHHLREEKFIELIH